METPDSPNLLDRTHQLALLRLARSAYPANVKITDLIAIRNSTDSRLHHFNLVYLIEHGLLQGSVSVTEPDAVAVRQLRITKDGIDFMEADGGLSAILQLTTIRLHRDDLQALIEQRIEESPDLSPAEKNRFVDQLRSLPGDATKQVTVELLKRALDHWPDALQYIRSLLG